MKEGGKSRKVLVYGTVVMFCMEREVRITEGNASKSCSRENEINGKESIFQTKFMLILLFWKS